VELDRQLETAFRPVSSLDVSVVGFRHCGNDGKTQTRSSSPGACTRVTVEHRAERRGRHAWASVSHYQHSSSVPLLDFDLNGPGARCVSQSVVGEVGDCSLDGSGIAFDPTFA